MTNNKDMTITEIEQLTYDEAKAMSIEIKEIKGHDCIFVDFSGYFGYSVLVFKNGMHIYYANDYELHHKWTVEKEGRAGLRKYYIENLARTLYTDEELLEEVKTYDEYSKKSYFLRNYWIMRYEYLSIFEAGFTKETDKIYQEKKKQFPFSNPVSFCYVKDKDIVIVQTKYMKHLESSYEKLKNNLDTFREMVSYQLANHEACITCDYTDALDALGMSFNELTEEKQNIVKEELRKQIHNYCEGD